MLDNFDLTEIAEAYFSVPTPHRIEYQRLLIRARDNAVQPILRAMLIQLERTRSQANDLGRRGRNSAFGETEARYIWAKVTVEKMLEDAHEIFRRIDERAYTHFPILLLESANKQVLIVAMLLQMAPTLSENTIADLGQRIRNLSPEPGEERKFAIMLCGSILAQAGNRQWQQLIAEHSHQMGLTPDEWKTKTWNSALIALQKG